MKNRMSRLALILMVCVGLLGMQRSTPVAEASWSVGMFTIQTCNNLFQHCRWVATELNFSPQQGCYYITWKGLDFASHISIKYGEVLTLTYDQPSSKPGHKTYGWGVPRRFVLDNSDWRNAGNWRFHKTC